MQHRTRRMAIITAVGSALVLAGTVATPLASASPPHGNRRVSFSSKPVTSTIMAHYTVTPDSRAQATGGRATANANLDDQLPDLFPKADPADRAGYAGAGPRLFVHRVRRVLDRAASHGDIHGI